MPSGVRQAVIRLLHAAREHMVTTTVFGISLAAIVALGALAATSGTAKPATAGPSGTGASGAAASPATGASDQQAPDFTLSTLGSSSAHVSLAAYAGRPVIVNFFASWCVPCRKETPLMARFYRSAHGTVNVIGIDTNDSQTAAMTFARSAGVSYPVAFDPAATTAGSFGVVAIPQTFFLNAEHRIVDRVYGAVTATSLAKGVALMNKAAAA